MKEPKIRFKGFKGEWEEKKIGTMTSVRGGYAFQSSLFQKSGIPVVRISNILSNGNVGGDFAYYPRLDGDTNITIHEKDVVIAMSGATTGKIARVDVGDGILYKNQRVGLFTKTGKVDYDFLYAVLNRPHFNELLNKLLTSSAQPNASSADIESIEMGFPEDAEEQKALSNYILSLDSLIQSTTKKIESLKQVKGASLQSMFPQEGETTPRMRFKGFEGEWEKVTIKDVATFLKGRGYSKSDLRVKGTPIILYGRIYTKYEACITNVDTYVNPLPNSIYTLGNEVVIPASGETPEDISCASAVKARGIILGGDLNILRFDTEYYDTTFVALSLSNGKAKKDLSNMAQGKSVVHLHNSDIEKVDMFIPSFVEQQQIASYFTNLDRQITLQTLQLEKLKQIKAACLDNMFV